MSKVRVRTLCVFILILGLFPELSSAGKVNAAMLPDGFTDTLVTTVSKPTALVFTPDGRMLITTQSGRLRVWSNNALLATPALDLNSRMCTDLERGMLGVAVDPAFATNRYIYLFYTFKKHDGCERNSPQSPVNRVARFTLPPNNIVDPASERVLIDNIPSPGANHNAGDLNFGKDGFLYISVGDGGCDYAGDSGCAGLNDAARDQHTLLGKILRITKDGGIPSSNPFRGTNSARCNVNGGTTAPKTCQETFSWGLRNPFRFAFDPNASGTRFYINDVGQAKWEEINLGQAGADYGWNEWEGECARGSDTDCGAPPAGMTNPIYDYGHDSCASITGGAFVPQGVWPSAYDGAYLFSDYVCGKIFTLKTVNGTLTRSDFISDLGSSSAVALRFGPSPDGQALYYTTYTNDGEIHRIAYTADDNRPPTAVATATPRSGAVPLAVSFSATSSSDPDGDRLSYTWDFGDGSSLANGATVSHTYTTVGTYQATLRVQDSRGASATATVEIVAGNTPPTPTIISPTTDIRYRVGQTITLRGRATDAQDGPLPDSRLSWTVTLHHDTHTHPYLQPTTGNNVTFTTPPPEDLAAARTSYLAIRLTATDAQGLSTVITQMLQPKKVNVTFRTVPAGLRLVVNDTTLIGPQTVTSWEGYNLQVSALAQQDAAGTPYIWSAWSDGGTAAHTITTPATAATYTATFAASPVVYATDDFNRTVGDGWGTANTGGPYTLYGSSRVQTSVGSGKGTMVLGGPAATRAAVLNNVNALNFDTRVLISTDKLATGGGGQFMYMLARRSDAGDEYRGQIRFDDDGSVGVRVMRYAAGINAGVGLEALIPGLSHTAGKQLWVRMQVSGTNPTAISMKAWASDQIEPVAWQISVTDSSPLLQVPGAVGLRSYLSLSATNGPVRVMFDSYSVRSITLP